VELNITLRFFAYPMANVLQSRAGARAVIGVYMVRTLMFSFVLGSNSVIFPCELPVFQSVIRF
jgi:hypothetical protein